MFSQDPFYPSIMNNYNMTRACSQTGYNPESGHAPIFAALLDKAGTFGNNEEVLLKSLR
jgi:hypothetical protein